LDNITNEHTYRIDERVLYTFAALTQRLKRICYLCDFILLVYTYALYNRYIKDLSYFAYAELGMILLLGFIQNRAVAPKGNFIVKTAIEVSITPEYIYLKTAAFKGPLWFKKESADVKINRSNAQFQEIANPYPRIFKSEGNFIRLTDGEQTFYLLKPYFNWRLEEELKER
jgi:hypothetical protein